MANGGWRNSLRERWVTRVSADKASGTVSSAVVGARLFSSGVVAGSYTLTALGGSYVISGANAGIYKGRVLTASAGSYTISGNTVSLLRSKYIAASSGSYIITGVNASLTHVTAATVYTLTALSGSYAIGGVNATILRSKSLYASVGSYVINGVNATLSRNRKLTASAGSYLSVGYNAVITYTPFVPGGAVWPAPAQVLVGVVYGPNGNDYTGTLDIGKKFRLDISTGNLVMIIDGKKVMSL